MNNKLEELFTVKMRNLIAKRDDKVFAVYWLGAGKYTGSHWYSIRDWMTYGVYKRLPFGFSIGPIVFVIQKHSRPKR